jgi:hypothetical protein
MNKSFVKVRITVRRIQRHPITKRTIRTGTFLQKHVIRSATLGMVPSTVNDMVFHHAQLNIDELIHIIQDQASISSISALMAIAMIASKIARD